MFLLYHAYVYLEFLILACTIYILASSAGGRTYYNTPGDNAIKSITNASIGQLWTFGAKCSQNTHSGVHWSGRINGKFKCIMEPYPGNELDL